MKVLVYCDTFRHVARFAREFASAPAYELYYLVAPRPREGAFAYAARQLVHAAYALLIDRHGGLFILAARGRLIGCTSPLEAPATLARVRRLAPAIALHSMDVIYRDAIITASGMGILNAHIGLLPDFRGRSVLEWSLLQGAPTGVTVFFIDGGVDTGRRIVGFFPAAPEPGESTIAAKRRLFHLAPAMYRRALDHIRASGALSENDVARGRRYYVMSRLFVRVVDGVLAAGSR